MVTAEKTDAFVFKAVSPVLRMLCKRGSFGFIDPVFCTVWKKVEAFLACYTQESGKPALGF